MLLHTLFATLFVGLATVSALPHQAVAPRSVPSGNLQCYYACPDAVSATPYYDKFDTSVYYGQGGASTTCQYYDETDENSGFYYCTFNTDTGVTITEFSRPECPGSVGLTGFCGSAPANDQQFKRSIARRRLTTIEQRIKNRQYKPVAGRRVRSNAPARG